MRGVAGTLELFVYWSAGGGEQMTAAPTLKCPCE